jgi:hypothetical protein
MTKSAMRSWKGSQEVSKGRTSQCYDVQTIAPRAERSHGINLAVSMPIHQIGEIRPVSIEDGVHTRWS